MLTESLQEDAPPARGVETARDFDLHGMVGIRLIGARPAETAAIVWQLGAVAAPLAREPDLVLRFVDRLPLEAPLRWVEVGEAGYAGDAFILFRGKRKAPVRIQIPFDALGGPTEIVCEHGLRAMPLLIALVNATVLANGGLPLHASAFRYRDRCVLATGWAKGGKTELLLGFMANGAEYIGDEWVYVDADRRRVFGVPEPLRLWDWHLEQLPDAWARLDREERLRLGSLRHATRWLNRAAGNGRRSAGAWRGRAQRLAELLERQRNTRLSLDRVFGRSIGPVEAWPDRVLLVVNHDSSRYVLEPARPEDVAARLLFSLREERQHLLAAYRKFRFAFPGRESRLLETADELERDRLRRFLADQQCHALYHPYPPSIPALFEAVRPLVEA